MTPQGRLLDELAANATVAPVTRLVDGWLAKAAPGLPFRRASSVLPAPGAGTDHRATTATLDELEAWYRSLGLRLLVQVSSADPAAASAPSDSGSSSSSTRIASARVPTLL